METAREFTYLDDSMSAGGECESAVTARKRCGWAKSMEIIELLCGTRFPLKLKGAVYKSYVKPVALHGIEAWCLKESSMVRAMCGLQLKNIKRSMDLMFILG